MAGARKTKPELLEIIAQSINDGGFNVLFIETAHPFLLKIYNETESYLLRIYIWNLSHGGGIMRAADEYRIQITGLPDQRFVQNPGEQTLILGWWNDVEVFAAFDYYYHSGQLGSSPSIQIREHNLRNALINGFSAYQRDNGEIAIAFRPDFFVQYVKQKSNLHEIGEAATVEVIEQVAAGDLAVNSQQVADLGFDRQIVIAAVAKKLRDNSFTKRVLTSYSNCCAFSGMQLRLVDAAHILPVSADNSTDETSNGIALSALYHRAYDRGLITFDEGYRTVVNDQKIEKLRELGLDGNVDMLLRNLRPIIIVPPAVNDRPNVNYVRQANSLRGW